MARRSEPMASRISGWGSGNAAGAAAGWGVAAGTAAAAGVLGEAGVDVTDKHNASAKITRDDRVRIFSFIVCSMTFMIFSQAPEIAGDVTIVASMELLESAGWTQCRKRKYWPLGAHELILISAHCRANFNSPPSDANVRETLFFLIFFSSGRDFDYCRRSHWEGSLGCSHLSALQGGNFRAGSGGAIERHGVPEVRDAPRGRSRGAHHFHSLRAGGRRDRLAAFKRFDERSGRRPSDAVRVSRVRNRFASGPDVHGKSAQCPRGSRSRACSCASFGRAWRRRPRQRASLGREVGGERRGLQPRIEVAAISLVTFRISVWVCCVQGTCTYEVADRSELFLVLTSSAGADGQVASRRRPRRAC